jgi:serine protease Do
MNNNRSGLATFFLAFFAAIIGALIMVFGLYVAASTGYLKLPDSIVEQLNEVDRENGTKTETNIEVLDVSSAIIEAVQKVRPAVVGVVNIQERSSFWNPQISNVDVGEGSGFVFEVKNGKGYVLTNHHVVDGAKELEIILSSGERVKGELIGLDIVTDLAIIAIDEKYVEGVAELGESTNLKVGETAIAIGNPLGHEFSQTVTVGVISSDNRILRMDMNDDGKIDWESEVIQTDAAINRGNSGGPLVNIAGQVIGVNNSKIDDSRVEGIGFAIPISEGKSVIQQLMDTGKVVRPFMGVMLYDVISLSSYNRTEVVKVPDALKDGVVITEVVSGGAAEAAGLKTMDVIVKLDNRDIADSNALRKYLYDSKKVGEELKVTFYRGGKLRTTTLVLAGNES